jgi:ribosome-binding factor A
MNNTQKPSHRIERVNALLQQRVGEIIHPYLEHLPGLTTVSRAEASRDLKWAKIYISIMGGDDDKVFQTIEKNIYDIQGELNRSFTMKIVPRLQFFLDTTPRYAQHIDELIKEIHEESES